jgi:TRAP-type C4-dicarboxylate transport system permease small subunit
MDLGKKSAPESGQGGYMTGVRDVLFKVSGVLHDIAGGALTVMMCLTVADVLGRAGGHPIMGTYEMVGLLGVIVVGLAIPHTSLKRSHVYMEFVLDRLGRKKRDILNICTRILCLGLFAFIGFNLFQVAHEFYVAGEVSNTLKIPIFPFAYAAGVCCFVECFVFLCDVIKIREGCYE